MYNRGMQKDSSIAQDHSFAEFEKIQPWRFYWDYVRIIVVIAFAVYLSEGVSFWFYPMSFVLIFNRLTALALLGHEGVHRLLSRNIKWNDFVGRYLCHFPSFISRSRYSALHIRHHRFVGHGYDPDVFIYQDFPKPFWPWLFSETWRGLFGVTFYHFYKYFNDAFGYFKKIDNANEADKRFQAKDGLQLLMFWAIVFTIFGYFDAIKYLMLYWVLPIILGTPYTLFLSVMQHGPMRTTHPPEEQSRTIVGNPLLIWLLFPLNVNYHGEHHYNPNVPHYRLKEFGDHLLMLREQGEAIPLMWRQTMWQAAKELWSDSRPLEN